MTPDEYLLWRRLIDLLNFDGIIKDRAVPRASPIPYYGDASMAEIATVTLRPGHGEFINRNVYEIRGQQRRFHTLRSLGLRSWRSIDAHRIALMDDLCRQYFRRNPYGLWHDRWASMLEQTGRFYQTGTACHWSLIPCVITPNGNRVMPDRKIKQMMKMSSFALAQVIRDSPVKLLVLNSNRVLYQFERLANPRLTETEQPLWKLSSPQASNNEGFAYQSFVSDIAGFGLGREVAGAGFNHNIISRYVDDRVRGAIAKWLGAAYAAIR